jgi:hypothetical protein
MVQRLWYDIDEVAQILNEKGNSTLINLFNTPTPQTSVYEQITNAYVEYHSFLTQIAQAMEWDCA